MKKVYLAGFDVFRPDGVEYGRKLKAICLRYGFEGLYPLDNEADSAEEIFRGNLRLIEQSDMVAANLNPFRGNEPDSGTAFEVGYAFANGKKVAGYLSDGRPLREKLGETDENGFSVENFHMAVNLMLGQAAKIVVGGLEECLRMLADEEDQNGEA